MSILLALSPLALAAASHPMDAMSWDTHPEMVGKDVRVAPIIVAGEAPQAQLDNSLGLPLTGWRADTRIERTQELAELPYTVHTAVPGVLNRMLPDTWDGHFRDVELNMRQHARLSKAASDGRTLTDAMGDIAQETGGDATLFIWVSETEGVPLTNEYMVGQLVMLEGIPVVVDHENQPYRVEVELGAALVSSEGQVLFRYQDSYRGLLADGSGLDALSHDLARKLVHEIAPVWVEGPVEQSALAEAE